MVEELEMKCAYGSSLQYRVYVEMTTGVPTFDGEAISAFFYWY